MGLPDLNDCSFFKKSIITADNKIERVIIYRLKTDPTFTFDFTCPVCGFKNAFSGKKEIRNIRENGKNKNYIIFSCKKCSTEFKIEQFKVRAPKEKS
jgi:transcription elongation factor Elf1